MLTATHIINRLPNAALNFNTPYKKLYNKEVDYDSLKTFGCLAVAYNSNHGGDKFAPQGVACAFIGYPSNTKGYRLLKLATMQPMISRHVVFYENIFPLNKNSDKRYMEPLPVSLPFGEGNAYDYELPDNMNNEGSILTENELESATKTKVEDMVESGTDAESATESPENDESQ